VGAIAEHAPFFAESIDERELTELCFEFHWVIVDLRFVVSEFTVFVAGFQFTRSGCVVPDPSKEPARFSSFVLAWMPVNTSVSNTVHTVPYKVLKHHISGLSCLGLKLLSQVNNINIRQVVLFVLSKYQVHYFLIRSSWELVFGVFD